MKRRAFITLLGGRRRCRALLHFVRAGGPTNRAAIVALLRRQRRTLKA